MQVARLTNDWDEEDERLSDPEVERIEELSLVQAKKERKNRLTAQRGAMFGSGVGRAFNERAIEMLNEHIAQMIEAQS